ncbi:PQQ-binding-like beta-propeller repeat protein [bacterium]|nr:PQQ-binding-like beta-propeller repeat protein [bacterium]
MTQKTIQQIVTAGVVAAGAALLGWWFFYNPVSELQAFVPGNDGRPPGLAISAVAVNIGARFTAFEGVPGETRSAWPRFRGADFDNISKEATPLADSWGADGPRELWSVDLGEGHAGPVIWNGRVFVMDYDEDQQADMLRCFSFADGREIWRRGYSLQVKRNHGMSRTVPAVAHGRVVTMGPRCHVMCVDAETGDFYWGIDVSAEYEAEVPLWYTGQCPLVDDSTAVIAVGGTSLMIGVDLFSGEVVWKAPNERGLKMSHSSVIPAVIHGRRMYLYAATGAFVGISAEKETLGEVLFVSPLWDRNVIAPSPVSIGDGRVFLTAGYGGGSMMVTVRESGGMFSVDSLGLWNPGEGLASEQQTPILIDGHLFAILPKDAGVLRNQFVCYSPDDCGALVWSSGKQARFGLGPYLAADGKFYILSDEGVLTMVRISSSGWEPLDEADILDGHDAWGPLALADGFMLARDSHRLVCIDLR